MGPMNPGVRIAAVGAGALVTACVLSSCGSSPTAGPRKAVPSSIITTTTTTIAPTTSTSSTTTTQPGVAVPNVIGLKIAAARTALRGAGFPTVGLNTPCNKGTLASQSVVASLSVPGKAPDPRVGAVPLNPGAAVPPGTRVAITWSGCYGNASAVPAVVGLTFPAARHALRAVGLTWACYSVGKATTTTTAKAPTSSTSTTAAVTTTTAKHPQTVLTQQPAAGTQLRPGAIVALTMHTCPQ
jgi:beta-lactam-binding protein with PASTA domain